MDVALRRREPGDDAFIEQLSEEAFGEYNPEARVRALPMARAGTTQVATYAGKPIGFAVIRRAGRSAHLDAIAVSLEVRGRGVGRLLLDAAERAAVTLGASSLELATAEANLAALELFLKSGYRIRKTVARFYPRGQTAHVLYKPLTASAN